MAISTGKEARQRGGRRTDIKRQNRHGNLGSYPVRHPNESNRKAREAYNTQKYGKKGG
jgi:hypothetical protein